MKHRDRQVFEDLLGVNIRIGGKYINPLNPGERTGSLTFAVTPDDKMIFHSFQDGSSGDVFTFVSRLRNVSRDEAKQLVNGMYVCSPKAIEYMAASKRPIDDRQKTIITIDETPFTPVKLRFWQEFGISLQTLERFNVKAIKGYLIGDRYFKINDIAYAYEFIYKDEVYYKIYRPTETKWKWLSNCHAGIVQGIDQLPRSVHDLWIQKSLKDVMLMYELEEWAMAPQAEGQFLPDGTLNKFTYNNLYVFADNDKAGIEYGKKNAAHYRAKLVSIETPIVKDLSDYYKYYGQEKTKELICTMKNL